MNRQIAVMMGFDPDNLSDDQKQKVAEAAAGFNSQIRAATTPTTGQRVMQGLPILVALVACVVAGAAIMTDDAGAPPVAEADTQALTEIGTTNERVTTLETNLGTAQGKIETLETKVATLQAPPAGPDADGDGVTDNDDQKCPSTPKGLAMATGKYLGCGLDEAAAYFGSVPPVDPAKTEGQIAVPELGTLTCKLVLSPDKSSWADINSCKSS